MEIKTVQISDLVPYKNNPRRNDEAVEFVKNNIEEFSFKIPLVIDENNVIICGHTRLKAAKALNMTEVPCVIADDLTPEQVKAFRLADNRVAEVESWDRGLLSLELENIFGIDISDLGFDADDIGFTPIDDSYSDEGDKPNYSDETQFSVENILNLAYAQFPGVEPYDFPEIIPNYEVPIVEEWIGFNYALSERNSENKGF